MQALLGSVLSISTDAIIAIAEHYRIQFFNKGAELIFGYSASEVRGQPVEMLMPVRSREPHKKHVAEFASGTQLSRLMHGRRELVVLRKDGTEFPAEASIAKLEAEKSRVFTVMLRDITERKQVEDTLRESEERYRELFDESPVAIWVEDWSQIKQTLHDLTRGRVKDWRDYCNSHRDQLK